MTSEFKVERVLEADTEDVLKLLSRTYAVDEPLNKAIGVDISDPATYNELKEHCIKYLPGLCLKAVNKDGNIAGVLVNAIIPVKMENDSENSMETNIPEFKKIILLAINREIGACLWEKYPDVENLLEIKIAATAPEFRNKGIMNLLMSEVEKTAKENGISLLRIDTTSEYSAKSAERFGYKCVFSKLYTEILEDGEPIIVPEPPHVYDRVFVKELH